MHHPSSGWPIYFTEYNGLDFYPETFTQYYFMDETHSVSNVYTAESLADWWGEAKIEARGQQCAGAGDPLQDIIGMGIELAGKDANGEEMKFRGFLELSQEIKE